MCFLPPELVSAVTLIVIPLFGIFLDTGLDFAVCLSKRYWFCWCEEAFFLGKPLGQTCIPKGVQRSLAIALIERKRPLVEAEVVDGFASRATDETNYNSLAQRTISLILLVCPFLLACELIFTRMCTSKPICTRMCMCKPISLFPTSIRMCLLLY